MSDFSITVYFTLLAVKSSEIKLHIASGQAYVKHVYLKAI